MQVQFHLQIICFHLRHTQKARQTQSEVKLWLGGLVYHPLWNLDLKRHLLTRDRAYALLKDEDWR